MLPLPSSLRQCVGAAILLGLVPRKLPIPEHYWTGAYAAFSRKGLEKFEQNAFRFKFLLPEIIKGPARWYVLSWAHFVEEPFITLCACIESVVRGELDLLSGANNNLARLREENQRYDEQLQHLYSLLDLSPDEIQDMGNLIQIQEILTIFEQRLTQAIELLANPDWLEQAKTLKTRVDALTQAVTEATQQLNDKTVEFTELRASLHQIIEEVKELDEHINYFLENLERAEQ